MDLQNVPQRSPNSSHPTAPPFVSDTYAKRPFRCCGETLAEKDFIPFTSGQIQCFPLLLGFLLFPSFDTPELPAPSIPHFDATVQTTGSVTLRLNQLYMHFLSLAHSIFPISALPYPSSFPEKSALLCNNQPLIVL